MKPRTKFEKYIVELNSKIKPISDKQKEWAFEKCFPHIAVQSKSGLNTCLDCAHQWQDNKIQRCPGCKRKIKIKQTLRRNFTEFSSITIFGTINNVQVIRTFNLNAYYRKKSEKVIYIEEISRIFITGTGKHAIVSKICYFSRPSGALELRKSRTAFMYDRYQTIHYPYFKLIPEIKRTGFRNFNKELKEFRPFKFIKRLLCESKFETIFKYGDIKLIRYFNNTNNAKEILNKYWGSIKIIMKRKYRVEDVSIWIDYLELLEHFNKDINNPKYICPKCYITEHNRLVKKKRDIARKEKYKELLAKIKEDNIEYQKQIEPFKKLILQKDNITIKIIETVKQLEEESHLLSHCAFENEYHKDKYSLLLSAKIDNTPIETIEVNLSNFTIVQARGYQNKPSAYNKEIVELVNFNLNKIKKLAKSKKTKSLKLSN